MHDAFEWIRQGMSVYRDARGYYLLPLLGAALVVARYLLLRLPSRTQAVRVARIALLVILVATALFSIAVYNNFFHYHYGGFLNAYEFFHYYLGSKYADEIGYFDMYGAALAADRESGRIYWPADGEITDLRSTRQVPVENLVRNEPYYRSLFSPGRWEEWVGDVFWFKQRMGSAAWSRILQDRGYNATPAWTTLVGRGLTRNVPTSSDGGMLTLAVLDVLLLAATVVAVGRVFGLWPSLLMIVLLASSYLMAHVHMKGAFLRTDFVVCLVLAVCALRRGRHGLAGALVGYSTMSRLFPAAFLFGPAIQLVFARPRFDRRWLRFFAGFALVVVVLFGLTLLSGGLESWSDFATKIRAHRADYHPWNVGLPSVVAARFEAGLPRLHDGAVEGRRFSILLIQALGLVASGFAVRRLEHHRALAFGFVPAFFLVAPTYYYYIVLLLPFLFLVERPRSASAVAGAAYLFVSGAAGHWLYRRWDQFFPTYYWNSVMLLALALYLLALAFRESAGVRRSLETPHASPSTFPVPPAVRG